MRLSHEAANTIKQTSLELLGTGVQVRLWWQGLSPQSIDAVALAQGQPLL